MSDYDIQAVPVGDVLDLRTALLLRHQAGSPSASGDDHPAAFHVAAFYDEVQVAIGSIHPEPMPDGYKADAWRIHDLAVDHGHRGIGVGAMLIQRCLEHAVGHEARAAWCLAPAGAFGFFERYGFQRTGDPIEASTGPQYLLFAALGPRRRSWSI